MSSSEVQSKSLQESIDEASTSFANKASELTSSASEQHTSFKNHISECLEHTNHMEAALASSGPFVASLERDILPDILENAIKLEDLFESLDVYSDEILPQIEATITEMEERAKKLDNERRSLEPSKLKQMISYFGSKKSLPSEPRPLWKDPKVVHHKQCFNKYKYFSHCLFVICDHHFPSVLHCIYV